MLKIFKFFCAFFIFFSCNYSSNITEDTTEREYKSVIILGIDGAGAFFQNSEMTIFNEIFKDGNIIYNMKAIPPTSSAQGWGSLFYGTAPDEHGIINQKISHQRYENIHLPSIVNVIHQHNSSEKIAVFEGWSPISTGLLDDINGFHIFPRQQRLESLTNKEILDSVYIYLQKEKPNFMFVQLDELDATGHKYGFESNEYHKKMKEIDSQIGEFYNHIKHIEDCLFIVTTDHGGNAKSHGGNSVEERECLFAIKGKGIVQNSTILDMEIRDISSIVLYALNIKQPDIYTSRIPKGIWNNVGGEDRPTSQISCISDISKQYRIHSGISQKVFPFNLTKKIIYFDSFETGNSQGFFGRAINCSNSYQNTNLLWNSGDVISIAFWIKAIENDGDPVILANKDWSSGLNQGFAIIQKRNDLIINIGDGEMHRYDLSFPLPYNYYDGWTHFLFFF